MKKCTLTINGNWLHAVLRQAHLPNKIVVHLLGRKWLCVAMTEQRCNWTRGMVAAPVAEKLPFKSIFAAYDLKVGFPVTKLYRRIIKYLALWRDLYLIRSWSNTWPHYAWSLGLTSAKRTDSAAHLSAPSYHAKCISCLLFVSSGYL